MPASGSAPIALLTTRTEDFVAAVKVLTDGVGADAILDIVGGDNVERILMPPPSKGASFRSGSWHLAGESGPQEIDGEASALYRLHVARTVGCRQGDAGSYG